MRRLDRSLSSVAVPVRVRCCLPSTQSFRRGGDGEICQLFFVNVRGTVPYHANRGAWRVGIRVRRAAAKKRVFVKIRTRCNWSHPSRDLYAGPPRRRRPAAPLCLHEVASPSPAPAATEKYWKPLEITVKMPNGVICKVEDIGLNHTMKELYDRVAVNRNTPASPKRVHTRAHSTSKRQHKDRRHHAP